MVTVDDETEFIIFVQDGHDLTVIDSDAELAQGEIYDKDVTFEYIDVEEGITMVLKVELVTNGGDHPSTMSGAIKAYFNGSLFNTIPMTCIRK